LGRAARAGLIEVEVSDIRDWAEGRHRQVDDAPYGGGAGMVLRVDVVARAVRAVAGDGGYVIHLTPAGVPFTQAIAERLAAMPHLVLLCGHYEGIDDRIDTVVDEEISLGDFVLTGGEIAACAVVDATARLRPGVLGNVASSADESFTTGLLEHPQYTRPREFEGVEVPDVLLSGDHARVAAFRRQQALERTRLRRPDLYARWIERGLRPTSAAVVDEGEGEG
jgi:tRNA (guanine37-N1)-methyltransferase